MEPSRELVQKALADMFAADTYSAAAAILEQYGADPAERERYRVQLAVLKLSDGDLSALATWVAVAKQDYRDVLGPAEYPLQMRQWGSEVSSAERERAVEEDRAQYLAWLRRHAT